MNIGFLSLWLKCHYQDRRAGDRSSFYFRSNYNIVQIPYCGQIKKHNANNACVFFMVGVTGFAPQPYGRRRFMRLFCAANAVAIPPGTKNSALCCFLNVPFKSLILGK